MLTKGMCADWAKYGIQVNAIGPGYFKTPLNQALVDNPEFSAWLEKRTPAGRWGNVEELIGAAVSWLPRRHPSSMDTCSMSMAASPRCFEMFKGAAVVMGVTGAARPSSARRSPRPSLCLSSKATNCTPPPMSQKCPKGMPLTDEDRWPWLERSARHSRAAGAKIAACSALKRSYRETNR